MRFKTRLFGIYTILCIIVAGSIAALYYYYNKKLYEETEQQILQVSSEQLVSELELVLENMEFATTYIVGENEFLDSLNLLLKNADNPDCPRYYKKEALMNIKKVLGRNFLVSNFYKVRIFNGNSLMIKQDSVLDTIMDHAHTVKEIPWLPQILGSDQPVVLVGKHLDDWEKNKVPVISMVRNIIGYDAYIEVQYTIEELEERLDLTEDVQGLLMLNEDAEILYQTGILPEDIVQTLKSLKTTKNIKDVSIGASAVISTSSDNGITTIVVGNIEKQNEVLRQIQYMTMLISFLTVCILLIFVNISAEIVVKPLKKLQKIMEITEFEEMSEEIKFSSHIRELDDLAHTYEVLLQRLKKSMIRNKKMEHLRLEAQFDSLQSKVSPHFMANILNVISSRGLELGDREICQISSRMGTLLRYSVDNRSQEVYVYEEIHHLEHYCYLMKARYMEKLIYEIEIPDDVRLQKIPKLSLQQLLENAIKHGFKNQREIMKIQVYGWTEGHTWYICVRDNGEGFSDGQIQNIFTKAKDKIQQIYAENDHVELTLGGMGLVNLYLRMYFLYGKSMVFKLNNTSEGAEVVIGGICKEQEE